MPAEPLIRQLVSGILHLMGAHSRPERPQVAAADRWGELS